MSTDSAKPAKKRLVIKPGMRIADLLILALVGNADNSKKTKIWRCQCLRCGREEDILQYKLPYTEFNKKRRDVRYACIVCKRGACVVCGGEILTDKYHRVCSDDCWRQRYLQAARNQYYKMLEKYPDYVQQQEQNRKNRLAKLSPEEYRAHRDRVNDRCREYRRQWTQQWRDNMTPEQREKYNQRERKRYQAARRRKAMGQLHRIGGQMIEKYSFRFIGYCNYTQYLKIKS